MSKGRAGKTKNVSVSLDGEILDILRARAKSMHHGNLSAAIAEAAEVLRRQAALDDVVEELSRGKPPVSAKERAEIRAEMAEGWAHARRVKRRRRVA